MSFYSKQNRFVRKTYSVTASADFESLYPPVNVQVPFNSGSNYQFPSGSYVYNFPFNPRRVFFDVPDRGKIVDLKVWVEFIHDFRPEQNDVNQINRRGLQGITIALRSPNTSFFSAHPLQNNETFKNKDSSILADNSTLALFDIYKNSYILWDGHHVGGTFGISSTPPTPALGYVSYGNDIDMRTVFSDSSPYKNPRNLEDLFPNATETDPGVSSGADLDSVANDGRALSASAPNHLLFLREGYPAEYDTDGMSASTTGGNITWMFDERIEQESITGSTNFTGSKDIRISAPPGHPASGSFGLGTSPPKGWLTGDGETAAELEFPTTGSQLGRDTVQPVYPLLDDIIVSRIWDDTAYSLIPGIVPEGTRLVGFRPGLRGTEVNGRWEFLIGNRYEFFSGEPDTRSGIWFRQVRLEFVIDQREGLSANPQTLMKYRVPSYVPSKNKKRIHILSGTAYWDVGINYVHQKIPNAYGRSIGISDDPEISPDSFAVFSQVTGSLVDRLSESEFVNLKNSFIRNEFGTPYIPISSGSGVDPSLDSFDQNDFLNSQKLHDVLDLKLDINQNPTLRSTLNGTDFFDSTAERTRSVVDNIDSGSLS